jgi:hypothetical protein
MKIMEYAEIPEKPQTYMTPRQMFPYVKSFFTLYMNDGDRSCELFDCISSKQNIPPKL